MASTYTTRARLEKQGDGENDDTWGTKLNTVLDLIDEGMEGYLSKSVAGGSDTTLTSSNSASDESRQKVLKLTGAITANVNVIVPATEKFYVVWNATTGFFSLTFKPSGGTGIAIPRGCVGVVWTDGSTMYRAGPWIAADADMAMPIPNLLPNGECRVWQRGTSFTAAGTHANNDDAYLMDGCVLLSDGNDIVDVSQETTTKPTGAYSAIKLDVETANKKFGLLFPLEAADSAAVLGGTASISFKARKGGSNATLETLRVGLITWSSTADSITSDVVSAWGSAGTNPTLAANWTYENTPANIVLTTSFVEHRVNAISVDTASGANVALFVWVDDTDATVADLAYLADFQIVPGPVATPIQRRSFAEDLLRCQRFYCKTFAYETIPAQNAGVNNALQARANGDADWSVIWEFPVTMRTAPTITKYNPSATNSDGRNISDGADVTGISAASTAGDKRVVFDKDGSAGTNSNDLIAIHAAATAEL